jgi:hypothetical protein
MTSVVRPRFWLLAVVFLLTSQASASAAPRAIPVPGYPNRIAGEAIPLEGRIVAVCDVFDALLHERPYKAAWTLADTRAEIVACSGRLFDPQVVTALLAVLDERERRGGRSPVPATPGS